MEIKSLMLLALLPITSILAKSFLTGLANELEALTTPVEEELLSSFSVVCNEVKTLLGISHKELTEDDLSSLTLVYRNSNVTVYFNLSTAADVIVSSPYYAKQESLLVVVHGFTSSSDSETVSTITEALMAKGEINVLALDATDLLSGDYWGWYLSASTFVKYIGKKLGQVLVSVVDDGVNATSVYVIGHSLGAHIAGFAGKTLYNSTGSSLGRITGLDPAGPCFTNIDEGLRLNKTDALFVDIIHSSAGVLGMKSAIGHLDFYPNGGTQQPDCLTLSCNHGRSWHYFAESVVNNTSFPAILCSSWSDFKDDSCNSTNISYMGYAANLSDVSGTYELQTSGSSPFGRGVDGLTFDGKQAVVETIEDQIEEILSSIL